MIGIVDYGMGNLLSVFNAVEMCGEDVIICESPDSLKDVERIILPGVGAFGDMMSNLKKSGLIPTLEQAVFNEKKPFLGICLGMQALARSSEEHDKCNGLGWLDADIIKLAPSDASLRIPHVGWNSLTFKKNSPLFKGLPLNPDFYFVHSFFMRCDHEKDVDAYCEYGGKVTAAVRKDNIFATQFHPEKSQEYGLKVLENFLEWTP
ncbi:glutamine amidotransferase [Maridesulfovibrio ferrireducens]|uniref:Imidazole glycerol phosphate synthase subunit HisH n=1 Tax=Maridesulfovibrio ferrireducens TaxID=246191 RepID=A0A1G9CPI1_9BACT|nr:imidazole glycerol phosphate synthase subunit HisH [Maridesulfovibrio ferrireducens]SDK53486.1 glutamine amidotransferase [Maridesulfovibrio ferrireducens]